MDTAAKLGPAQAGPTKKMSRVAPLKVLIFCHRWLGVFWCALFALWFLSAISMMYWGYPSVEPRDRLSRAPALQAAQIRVSPQDAYESLHVSEAPDDVQLETFNKRPVYRFHTGRRQALVFADNGQPLPGISPTVGAEIAAAWSGQPANGARFEGSLTEVDQWTVGGPGRALWPLLKYSWPSGDEVYVS